MSVTVAPPPFLQFFNPNNSGSPAVNFQLFTYQAGSSTKQSTWTDSTQTSTNANPLQLNGNGYTAMWGDPTVAYKLVWAPANDTDPPTSPLYTLDNFYFPANLGVLTQGFIGSLLYPRTDAEIAAGVTPVNYAYAPGDLRRYGAKIDSSTDDTTAINNAIKVAIAGLGFVYHPGGTCIHASQILAAGGWTLLGYDRSSCIFQYTGSAGNSAWRITNNGTSSPIINTSGFGKWNIDGVTITTSILSSTGAALEINAGGYSFYEIRSGARLTGSFKYGLILDAAEISHVHSGAIIDNTGANGALNAANIWLTNGPDRVVGQNVGFTNSILIEGAQINMVTNSNLTFNIIDDGGSNHSIIACDLNGAGIPIHVAAVEALKILNNEMENALGASGTGSANIFFSNVTAITGAAVGACQGFEVGANFFGCDMLAASSSLKFVGAMHQGGTIKENWFRNNQGRSADIDVTSLSNSFCGQNYASASAGQHYTGVHNDANGNILWPPQNGYTGGFAQNAYTWGDTRFRHYFTTGLRLTKIALTYSASITPDCRQGNIFQITATNNTAFTINVPTGDPTNGDDGTIITIQIKNTSGGALGAITFDAGYKLAGAFTAPATGNNRSITFYDDNVAGVWYEISRTAADTPN